MVARRTIEGEGSTNADTGGPENGTTRFVPTNAWAWKAVGIIEMVSLCSVGSATWFNPVF